MRRLCLNMLPSGLLFAILGMQPEEASELYSGHSRKMDRVRLWLCSKVSRANGHIQKKPAADSRGRRGDTSGSCIMYV
ncbi:hypothetical protein BofuT4_uP149310.1 [Botrytis cinerea T4]|uniref:Secreted protein n=1 Tax=Botryotinia fuckeliana (strain T4) TaxID=999810 RepID=G2YX83_BOTF4|nr:hypothetical protein BofuT4_uP149310.1 [Botrytis cinerea T4]